ncbi:molybdenum cofactor guanylyltransferase MobA [Inhella proteolytica]|nr:molybdenum cofactor guanylyltransferase MobA [Inhella proteolytica]
MADPPRIAAVVLAGGEGRRMGGADKGLLTWRGRPLVDQVLERLRSQTGVHIAATALSVNRHLDDYRSRGLPLLTDPDTLRGQGPLAGMLQALAFARGQGLDWVWMLSCDAPALPPDLAGRLCERQRATQAPAVLPAVQEPEGLRWHPAHALLHVDLEGPIRRALENGQRRVLQVLQQAGAVALELPADAAPAFANFNRPEDLAG